jgi:hypothetical protein
MQVAISIADDGTFRCHMRTCSPQGLHVKGRPRRYPPIGLGKVA